jgi:hypothetical protein
MLEILCPRNTAMFFKELICPSRDCFYDSPASFYSRVTRESRVLGPRVNLVNFVYACLKRVTGRQVPPNVCQTLFESLLIHYVLS